MRILDNIERITRPTSALAQTACKLVAGGMIGATFTNSVGGALGGAVTIGCYPFTIGNPRKILLAATVFAAHKAAADYLLQNHSFLAICTALTSGFLFGTRQVQEVVITAATATASTYLPTAISFIAKTYLREATTIASITAEFYGAVNIGYLLPQLIQGDRSQTLRKIGFHAVSASITSLCTRYLYNPKKEVAHWSGLAVVGLMSMATSAIALYLRRALVNPNPAPPQPVPQQGPPPPIQGARPQGQPQPPQPYHPHALRPRRLPSPQQPQPIAEHEHRNAELDRLRAELDRVSAQIRDSSSNEGFGRLYAEFDRLNAQLNRLNALPPPVRPDPDDNSIRDIIDQFNAETNRLNAAHARRNAELESLIARVRSDSPPNLSDDEEVSPPRLFNPPVSDDEDDEEVSPPRLFNPPISDDEDDEEVALSQPTRRAPDEGENVGYYKQAGSSKKEVAYKMVRQGKVTENVIRLGPKYADLTDISFPKAKHRIDLPDILNKMMEEEGIDGIRTNSLTRAYQLWTCKLRTDAMLKYKLEGKDQLNLFIREVIEKAMANPSSLPMHARQALLRVESMMIQAIVADHLFENTEDMSLQDLHQAVTNARDRTILDEFNGELCRCRITQLEELLDYHFDLQAITRLAIDDKQEQFVQLLKMIPADPRVMYARHPFKFEILIEDLFILMEATKTKLNRGFIQRLPTITFTKPPMPAITEGKRKKAADFLLILKEMAMENKTATEVSGNAAFIPLAEKLIYKVEKLERLFNLLLPSASQESERVIPRISFDNGIPAELKNDPIFSLFINNNTGRPICFELYFDGRDIREVRGVQNHNMHQLPAVKALIEAQKGSYNGQGRPSPAILAAAWVELQRVFPAFPNLDKLQQLIVQQKDSAEVVLSFEKGIPQELEDDMIFRLFECPITGAPIREFSLDPTQKKGKTLYERKLLEVWANKHRTSPTTRRPLESSEVIRLPKLTKLISYRIRSYKAKKWTQAEIERMLNTPPDPIRLHEALSELQQHGIDDPGLQTIIDVDRGF